MTTLATVFSYMLPLKKFWGILISKKAQKTKKADDLWKIN
jgi:hypothetical protein